MGKVGSGIFLYQIPEKILSDKIKKLDNKKTISDIQPNISTTSTLESKKIEFHKSSPNEITFGGIESKGGPAKPSTPKAATGAQTTLAPTGSGNGNGKVVYFFSGYTGSDKDQGMYKSEKASVSDDITKLRKNGFTVIVDPSATKKEFQDAVYDNKTAGVYWTGHGFDGGVQTSDLGSMLPSDIDSSKVSKNLRFTVFQSCNTGKDELGWEKALKSDVIAWNKVTSTSEARDFNTPNSALWEYASGDVEELDDLIEDKLINKPF